MKKITKILIVLLVILIAVYITFLKYVDTKADIGTRIGNKLYGGALSTVEFAKITKVYGKYLEMIKNGEYENAYSICSYKYRNYRDYEYFLEKIKNENIETYELKDINKLTEYMYLIVLNDGQKELKNLVIYIPSTAKYQIVPETFLEHKEVNKKIKKKNVTYEILETSNYTDKFLVKVRITNESKKESANISSIKLVREEYRSIYGNLKSVSLSPLEEKILEIEFETSIEFPNAIEFSRNFSNGTSKTYTIEFED